VNDRHHTVYFLQNVSVPKPKHAVALRLKIARACIVSRNTVGLHMPTTVNLDNGFGLMTCKVGIVRADRRLAAEMAIADFQLTQMPPQFSLGIRHHATQLPRPRHARVRFRLPLSPLPQEAPHP
jgi:hypothetical protein